jgi:hypothetical protein
MVAVPVVADTVAVVLVLIKATVAVAAVRT